jgi:hypothetical protein
LAAVLAFHLLLSGELFDARYVPPARANEVAQPAVARAICVLGRAGRDVDADETAKIDGIGGGRPGSAEEVRVGDLQPERAPPARRVAGEKAGVRLRRQTEAKLEIRDELFDERAPPRPVAVRVCEQVVPGRERRVQKDVDHFAGPSFDHGLAERRAGLPRLGVIAAESMDVVESRVGPIR